MAASQSHIKPSWADSVICPTTTNVWNRNLTGLFRDASFGKFWMIGNVYPSLYIFQQNISFYADPSRRIGYAVKELLQNIDVNFAEYDKFDPYDLDGDGNKRESDTIVDFVFINFRFNNAATIDLGPYTGIAKLGVYIGEFGAGVSEITLDGKRICAGFPGSGCLYEMNTPWDIGVPAHEFGEHYTYGSRHSLNMGAYNMSGSGFASAYDREHIGWNINTAITSSSNITFTLRDYVTTGDYIKIPRSDYVLYLENRRRFSYYASNNFRGWKWLASDPTYPQIPDSGLVVYTNTAYRSFDIQSAFGNWNFAKCLPSNKYKVDFYSNSLNSFLVGNINRFSGQSTFDLRELFSLNSICEQISVPPVFPNVDKVTYHGVNGDSNTCFDVGYNQVYSTWSNPPIPINATNDSLTVEITGRNSNGDMLVSVYYTNILGASPSKPYGLLAVKNYIDQPPSIFHPRLTWNRNLEPDLQKYIIYRDDATSTGGEPTSYEYLTETTDTFYTDVSLSLRKSGGGSGRPCAYVLATYSYKVSSVDFSDKELL